MAWDDFSRLVEIITGIETSYDTVVVTYQNVTEAESMDQEPDDDENLSSEVKTCFTKQVTEAIHNVFIRRKDVEHTSQVL